MLDKVKATIDNLPDVSFEQFYIQYIMNVQDNNIELESIAIFKHVSPDVSNLISADHLIHRTFERLVK